MTKKPAAAPAEAVIATSLDVGFRMVDDLKPYAGNARRHTQAQVEQIAGLIEKFGWTNPVLADDLDNLHAGHGRLLAAKRIYAGGGVIRLPNGRELPPGTIPVVDCTGWSEEKRRAYIIADNRVAEASTWDEDILKVELAFLKTTDLGATITGFDEKAIGKLLAEAAVASPPDEFKAFGDDIATDHQCPKCGYRWSGKAE